MAMHKEYKGNGICEMSGHADDESNRKEIVKMKKTKSDAKSVASSLLKSLGSTLLEKV